MWPKLMARRPCTGELQGQRALGEKVDPSLSRQAKFESSWPSAVCSVWQPGVKGTELTVTGSWPVVLESQGSCKARKIARCLKSRDRQERSEGGGLKGAWQQQGHSQSLLPGKMPMLGDPVVVTCQPAGGPAAPAPRQSLQGCPLVASSREVQTHWVYC